MAVILGIVVVAVWIGLAVGWHGFWRTDQRLPSHAGILSSWPHVAVVIPARNEAETIEAAIKSATSQNYPGRLSIVAVNDNSTDDTARLARAAAEGTANNDIVVIDALPLAAGWSGKLWALDQGITSASTANPDYYWLTDADIVHGPGVLCDLVYHSKTNNLALTSLMVRLRCQVFWEMLLVPAFIFFFSLLYPFRAVNTAGNRIAGAAGGCMLVQREALIDIGGIAAIKGSLIDDCSLAQAIKSTGRPVWLGLAEQSHSLRGYDTLASFWMMVVRSAFVQLNYSGLLLVGCIAGLTLSFGAPLWLVATAPWNLAGLLGLMSWTTMSSIYWPTVRYYRLSPPWAVTLPFAALLFGLMTLHSAVRHWLGRGSAWKDRELHDTVKDR